MSPTATERFELREVGEGRPLLVTLDGRLYLSRGYSIYVSSDDGRSWSFVARLPIPPRRLPGQYLRLAARLLRFEVRALLSLEGGSLVAANRDGVYYSEPGEPMMRRARIGDDIEPEVPPYVLTPGPQGRVVFGEYYSQLHHGKPVRVFASDDGGKSFEVAHCFEGGQLTHVHSLLWDSRLDHYWIFTGDLDEEVGIGILSRDLEHFEWLVRGEQKYRLCEAFDFGDRLIYATDTPFQQNAVISLEKSSGRTEILAETGGSCLNTGQFGELRVFSTTVETLSIDACKSVNLWASRDGDSWSPLLEAEKDLWHLALFQFGSLILPRGISDHETIFFSGQAVKLYDGRTFAGKLS